MKKIWLLFIVSMSSLLGVVSICAGNDADEALKKLMDGNQRFASDRPAAKNLGDARRKELTKGQHPFAVVLSCSDSRVPPEHLFDQGLGDIFVIRTAGNTAQRRRSTGGLQTDSDLRQPPGGQPDGDDTPVHR